METKVESKFNKDIWSVLEKIKDGLLRQMGNENIITYTVFTYPLSKSRTLLDVVHEQDLIRKLKKDSIVEETEEPDDFTIGDNSKGNPKAAGISFHLKINEAAFNRYYEQSKKENLKAAEGEKKNSSFEIIFSKDLYDEATATLKLGGEKIDIPNGTNQDYLCRVLFLKFPEKAYREVLEPDELEKAWKGTKEWSCDEIVELSGDRIKHRTEAQGKAEKEEWRTVYNAANSINDLIAKETTVKDFFLTKPISTVKINPKHLK